MGPFHRAYRQLGRACDDNGVQSYYLRNRKDFTMGSVVSGFRHALGAIASPITKLFDLIPLPDWMKLTILSFPPLTLAGMAVMGAKAAQSLSKDPPDWGGVIS